MLNDIKEIRIEKTNQTRIGEFDENNLKFGREFTDHMFVADYHDGEWQDARIIPYQNLSLSPATSFIHYGQSIFEGLKAHKSENGEILVFRPDANWKRMNESAHRMCMAQLPRELFMDSIIKLLQLDSAWMPSAKGTSMYIRPFMFATEPFLGVKPSPSYRFMVILSPSGSYYSEPVRVKIEKHYARAMEGGVGSAKTSGNYAASLYPALQGMKEGYDQLIWTDAKDHERIEEAGTMNIMFVVDGKVITPKPSTSILDGITRQSVVQIARDWGYEVEQRTIYVKEILEAIQNGTLTEAFGVGTAATIAPIKTIGIDGVDYDLNPVDNRPFSQKMGAYLSDYKHGKVDDEYHWLVRV
ncbi:branched-chain amino acid aminotransferase [bacterium SCSIO 12741]|nr:branched-chain amino acid aminotransferase [bacterium SCSIO 12741]